MSSLRYRAVIIPAVLVTAFAGLLLARSGASKPRQDAPAQGAATPPKMLVVNGTQFPNALAEVGGHYYVSLDSLAQITNGQLSIEPSRVVLVTRGETSATAPSPAAAATEPPPLPDVMTREFARAGLSALAYMREWKAAVATVVAFGVPVVGTWPDDYRERVQESVAQAQVAAATNQDRDALAVLQNEANNLMSWSGQVISQRQSLNAAQNVDPNALSSDLTYQKISKCAEFLNGMLGSGVFSDDSSCH